MNKKVLVIIALVLLLGSAWYLSSKKSKELTSTQNSTGTANTNSQTQESIKSLLTKGIAQTCTYSSDAGEGTVYVDKGKVRGDFSTSVEGQTISSHMIVMDSTSYIWTDGQPTGFKMEFDPASPDTSVSNETQNSAAANLDANYNYKCTTGVADPTKFVLPTDVTFNTFTVPSGATSPQTGSGSSGSSQCSYCSALSGDDKAQCLAAFKCN